jgi:hypothetical protein
MWWLLPITTSKPPSGRSLRTLNSRSRLNALHLVEFDFIAPAIGEQIPWSKNFSAKYSAAAEPLPRSQITFMDFFRPIRFNGEAGRRMSPERNDEKAYICSLIDCITCMGANEIVTQERDRAHRQLRANWPNGGWQTCLFHEVREFTDAAASATASRNQGSPSSGAGRATKRDFRLVL